jgi:hypothetical protein
MTASDALTLARARRAEQQHLARLVADVARRAWSRVDPRAIVVTWRRLLGEPLAYLAVAQLQAAESADRYVTQALAVQGATTVAEGAAVPRAFAGVASDGRRLDTLLYQPVVRTLELIGAGAPPAQALAFGSLSLDMLVRTQIADAGRLATGVSIAARPRVGYVRLLTPPSCSRCALLAGKYYRWSTGFQRHPKCDCIHIPAVESLASDLRTSPRGYFDSLSLAEQNRVFTHAGAQAIRDGADIGRVVNARRGMSSAGTTRELARTQRRAGVRGARPTPEEIYRLSAGDRDEAIRLLRLHGYLI